MADQPPPNADSLARRMDKLYEFEREPISQDRLHPGRRFAALFAGEHVAATEFVIGVLFVQWGTSARDLVYGLLLGNLLAVLSWALICSPIAVQVRLTLYWYVRRIIGPGLTVVYNFVNAVLYCCLAAAMIGVSGSAVILALSKLGIEIEHPTLQDVYPNSVGWVIVVLAVGAVVVTLAILGFKKLSQFAQVCAPWMFLVFIAGALVSLPRLGEFNSFDDLWHVAETEVWTGRPYESTVRTLPPRALPEGGYEEPVSSDMRQALLDEADDQPPVELSMSATIEGDVLAPQKGDQPEMPRWRISDEGKDYIVKYVWDEDAGESKVVLASVLDTLGFWHVVFFAWFCNLAMHVGLSDMAIFRYAKHWSYGFYSAFGMYLGHFLAWICAGIMGAVVGKALNPGEMADTAAGMAGVLAVLIAGWTTANPTIYRAGLALQILTPNWPRWQVTLAAGVITAVVGCFPAIFMQLLDFVAIYGLMLMPIGAVIVIEHWLFPRVGLPRYWVQTRGLSVNGPALLSWLLVLVLSFPIEQFTDGAVKSPMAMMGIHLFFRWLPGWFIAAIAYIVLCMVWPGVRGTPGTEPPQPASERSEPVATQPAKSRDTDIVAWIAGGVAALALVACIFLPIQVLIGGSDPSVYASNMDDYKNRFLVATVVYFVAAIVLTSRRDTSADL